MERESLAETDVNSLESVLDLRLRSLLHDLLREKSRSQVAEQLGISYKTLVRSLESGRLTVHMKEALMEALIAGWDSRAEEGVKRADALEQSVGELVRELRGALREVGSACAGQGQRLREEVHGAVGEMLKRLAEVESRLEGEGGPGLLSDREVRGPSAEGQARGRPRTGVVTVEQRQGEEEIHGDAMSVVMEWRQRRREFAGAKGRLARAKAEERLRELEVTMIGERRLTLPPETQPWDDSTRRSQLELHRTALERARKERVRAEWRRRLRLLLTLGRWGD